MKKIIQLTENELINIVKKVLSEQINFSTARMFMRDLIKLPKFKFNTIEDALVSFKSAEHLIHELDSVIVAAINAKKIENLNYLQGQVFEEFKNIKRLSEADSIEQTKNFLNAYAKKKGYNNFAEIRKLAEKTEQKVAGQVGAVAKNLTSFEKNFLLNNCHSAGNCPGLNSILNSFVSRLPKTKRFNPANVKILSSENIADREVIYTQLEDGSKILFYKSSGQNVATTGKQAGEWFVIPGFGDQGWFFKTSETVNLTKGGNQYLTDMAEFLYANGSKGLGK